MPAPPAGPVVPNAACPSAASRGASMSKDKLSPAWPNPPLTRIRLPARPSCASASRTRDADSDSLPLPSSGWPRSGSMTMRTGDPPAIEAQDSAGSHGAVDARSRKITEARRIETAQPTLRPSTPCRPAVSSEPDAVSCAPPDWGQQVSDPHTILCDLGAGLDTQILFEQVARDALAGLRGSHSEVPGHARRSQGLRSARRSSAPHLHRGRDPRPARCSRCPRRTAGRGPLRGRASRHATAAHLRSL